MQRLQIKPPYVLVARSYGSLISGLYVSRYPSEVAGIVLVDGTHEQQVQRFGTLDSTYPRKFTQYYDSVLRSMKSDESAPYVNGTARGHVVWRELHDEWFRRSRNGIHIQTTRSGHGIQDDEPSLAAAAIKFVVESVNLPAQSK